MSSESDVLQALEDLVGEIEGIQYDIEQDGLTPSIREELEKQSGTIKTILEDWEND